MSIDHRSRGHLKPIVTGLLVAIAAVSAPAFAGSANLAGLSSDTSFDQFIVKYRDGSPERRDGTALQRSLGKATQSVVRAKGKALGLKHHRRMALGADVVRADRRLDRVDAATLMRQIAADPNVEYVEVDVLHRALLTPNDTRYGEQWHYANSAVGANVSTAWDRTNGSGVVVAVVDSGKLSHTDLNANYVGGYDFVSSTSTGNAGSNDGNGRDSDATDASNVKHGNHVAGTIAAVTNNASGVAGVAYGAKVVPIRVLGNNGYGSTSDIADGIVWASGGTVSGVPANANPARVINLSLGGSGACSTTYQNAINTATNNGSVVVIAAGNSNSDTANFSPANCANTVTVAASDINGNRAWYSNYGTTIDITAPGGETCSPSVEFLALGESVSGKCTQNHASSGILSTTSSGTYEFYQGTSMATPHVAGIIAMMQAVSPTPKTTAQILSILTSTARPIASAKCPGGCGAGLIDAAAAVTSAAGGGGGGSAQTYSNTADYTIADNATISSPITVSGRSGNGQASTPVAVNIVHTYIGDLKVDLVAPDGSVYVLHDRAGGSADNINQTYTVNLSGEVLNGTWNLRVNDNANADVGYINSWSITF